MTWTNKQKQIAVRSCKAAGISDDQRTNVLLRQLPHAMHQGKHTSTSPRLTNGDFEFFLAIIERSSGGQIKLKGKAGKFHFSPGYWQTKADDNQQRFRWRIKQLAGRLEAASILQAGGVGLAGWILNRITRQRTDDIAKCTATELRALYESLKAHAARHGVVVT